MKRNGQEQPAAARGVEKLRVAFVADSHELRSLVLDITSEADMSVWVAERETVQPDDLARFEPDVFLIDPCGAAGSSRPPFTVALSIRQDPRLAETPLVLVTDDWTLALYAAEVAQVRPDATLLMPFQVDQFVATVRNVVQANRTERRPRAAAADAYAARLT